MADPIRVAVLGTGLLGSAVAERLLEQGHEVTVWNRTREKAEVVGQLGARVAPSPAAAARSVDAVITLLTDGPALRAVLLTEECLGALAGRTVIQMGTISPEESRALAAELRRAGGSYLEAPVLGSTPQASAGQLLLMAAGEQALVRKWEPLLAVLSEEPMYIGELGKAASLKLALNQLLVALVASFSLSLAMVREAEVPLEPFIKIVRSSSLHSPQFDKKLPGMLARDFSDPHFPVAHMLKDVDLALAEAGRLGLGVDALQGIRAIVERALAMGFVDVDYSALYNAIHPPDLD